jgi:hypothetical protein
MRLPCNPCPVMLTANSMLMYNALVINNHIQNDLKHVGSVAVSILGGGKHE